MALFAEQGYGATSLEQIAAAAGISRTTLFSYFPAKRDLVWLELNDRAAAAEPAFATDDATPLVDLIVARVLLLGRYPSADRELLALRLRLVEEDDELRAFGTAQSGELARVVVEEALRRAPGCDLRLVDHVAHALIAVTVRSTVEWSQGHGVDRDLQDYAAAQLQPIADALRPLLP